MKKDKGERKRNRERRWAWRKEKRGLERRGRTVKLNDPLWRHERNPVEKLSFLLLLDIIIMYINVVDICK